MRNIMIVNQSSIKDDEVVNAMSALQIQFDRDFSPIWEIYCKFLFSNKPNDNIECIHILDTSDQAGALGYHEKSKLQIPQGYVFTRDSIKYTGNWTDTLSHEAMEQAADPLINLGAVGVFKGKACLYAYENADPVENDEYIINGIKVSNFITPEWFDPEAKNIQFDFMKKLKAPFTMSKGGYISYSLTLGRWLQVFAKNAPKHQKAATIYHRRVRRR